MSEITESYDHRVAQLREHDLMALAALAQVTIEWQMDSFHIAIEGGKLFGNDWTTWRQTSTGMTTMPLVSFSLGRLRKLDFVTRGRKSREGTMTWHHWHTTKDGRQLAADYLGIDKCPPIHSSVGSYVQDNSVSQPFTFA